jgi:hypothetical protein
MNSVEVQTSTRSRYFSAKECNLTHAHKAEVDKIVQNARHEIPLYVKTMASTTLVDGFLVCWQLHIIHCRTTQAVECSELYFCDAQNFRLTCYMLKLLLNLSKLTGPYATTMLSNTYHVKMKSSHFVMPTIATNGVFISRLTLMVPTTFLLVGWDLSRTTSCKKVIPAYLKY